MILLGILLISIIGVSMTSCTSNQQTKLFGGTQTIELGEGRKLIEVTWKGEDMWVLSRPRRTNEPIETYTFQEKSNFGVMEGKVIINEN